MPALAFMHESAGRDPLSSTTNTETAVERSADARPEKPAQIHADTERVAVELQWNAAAKVKLEIQVAERFVIHTGVEAVVTHEIRGAGGNAGGGEALAVRGLAAS